MPLPTPGFAHLPPCANDHTSVGRIEQQIFFRGLCSKGYGSRGECSPSLCNQACSRWAWCAMGDAESSLVSKDPVALRQGFEALELHPEGVMVRRKKKVKFQQRGWWIVRRCALKVGQVPVVPSIPSILRGWP